MKKKEIYEKIVRQRGFCNGIRCCFDKCPYLDGCVCSITYTEPRLKDAKQKLKEMKMKVPELVGVEMLVSGGGLRECKRYVLGRLPNGYLLCSKDAGCCAITCGVWNLSRPIPETVKMTVAEVSKMRGCTVEIVEG